MSIQFEEPLAGSYGVVDSFPKDFGYGVEEADMEESSSPSDSKPRILLMGLRRSGKSSIQKVFQSPFIIVNCRQLRYSFFFLFGDGCEIISSVLLQANDDYVEALGRLHLTVSRAYRVNPEINFEVFIHKVDGLSDDHKIETQRDIHQRANDDLADAGLEKLHLRQVFYLTSIYDHSIFEAFSKVVQKLIPQLPTLENLLNIFISVCIPSASSAVFYHFIYFFPGWGSE
ncbi:RRAGC protein, partial [Polyodon spathula]|nr:RRAGC protein [Polyodon spathula]